MHKIIKHSYEFRSKIFFSSDWHIFHNPSWISPIWKMRGYDSLFDSVRKIQEKINERVDENSILYVLGDLFLDASDEQCLEWLKGLQCKDIRKIFGNHTSNMYRLYKQEVKKQYGLEDMEIYPIKMGNITFLGNHQEIQIGKKHIVLNHFPLRTHNHASHLSWNLGGHEHGNDPERLPKYPLGKTLDVSWDVKLDVWSYNEIEDVMSTKEILVVDHHSNGTN